MFGLQIAFDEPHWLWLALAIPALWVWSHRALASSGRQVRKIPLLLRSLILAATILALAEPKLLRETDRVTVLYLLDQSESIPLDHRQEMLEYVTREVAQHRRENRGDRAGILVFGGEARVEIPPVDMELPALSRVETLVDLRPEITSLSAALELAKASFPEDSARRVVVVSDGNENLGDALRTGKMLSESGIGIDVVPVRLPQRNEVSIEQVVVPTDLRLGQAFEAKVVIENRVIDDDPNPTMGIIRLIEREGGASRPIGETRVELKPGTNVVGFAHQVDRTAMLTYEASFVPDDAARDFRGQNNRGSAYTHVRGRGRVLWIEDGEFRGEYAELVGELRTLDFEIDMMSSDALFSSPAELIEYDCVVLANLPRSGGEADPRSGGAEVYAFSDAQIEMLVRNTEEFGCGLVMLGGDRAFGAGGWSNTRLEEAMPVDFQILNDRIEAVGALAIVMHASEMAAGNYWQKVIGVEAIRALGPMDYCGVAVWNDFGGGSSWLWNNNATGLSRVGANRRSMLAEVQKMAPGDMPDFDSSMALCLRGLQQTPASIKHMIIISDGDPTGPSPTLLQQFVDTGIEISTVAVGTHGPATLTPLERIAETTGGKFYLATDPQSLPRIFQREARKVARPLIFEQPSGIGVLRESQAAGHPLLQGIPADALPPILGYVATTLKDNPLVESLLLADRPADHPENATILATWRFGLGRTTVVTTDAGRRWAGSWKDDDFHARFYAQLLRHAMRPVDESAEFTVASRLRDGRVVLTVDAVDQTGSFLNGLPMVARAVAPDLTPIEIPLRQVRPGRYEASFAADAPGGYLFTILPGEGYERLSGGITVPVSGEFDDRITNLPLLNSLASLEARGGSSGVVVADDVNAQNLPTLLEHDTFRRDLAPATSLEELWPWLLFAVPFAFLVDVAVRRLSLSPWQWLRQRLHPAKPATDSTAQDQRLERLRQAKLATQQRDSRTSTREQSLADKPGSSEELLTEIRTRPSTPSSNAPPSLSESSEVSYTERLRQAKRRATQDRRDPPDRPPS